MIGKIMSVFLVIVALASFSKADLFTDDATTRKQSTADESGNVVRSGSASGILIADNIILTAAHLRVKPMPVDGHWYFPKEILEHDSVNDYVIFRMEWGSYENGVYTKLDRPASLKIVKIDSEVRKNLEEYNEEIKVIGFPKDKADNQSTSYTSIGDSYFFTNFEKRTMQSILYNAGVTVGNSGGPILNSKNELIGMVQGGRSDSYEAKADKTDPQQYNYGLSISSLYEKSEVFRKIVDGK